MSRLQPRTRDLLIYGVAYPLAPILVAIFGGAPAERGELLLIGAAVGAFGLVIVFGLAGGPWAIKRSWQDTAPEEPLPGDVRQALFLAVAMVAAGLLGILL